MSPARLTVSDQMLGAMLKKNVVHSYSQENISRSFNKKTCAFPPIDENDIVFLVCAWNTFIISNICHKQKHAVWERL